jgi:hypothetical protein
MQQQDFDLLCQVMTEDSLWLDSHQASLLQNSNKLLKRVELINEEGDDQSNFPSEDIGLSFSSSRQQVIETEDPSIVKNLPAAEFINGNRSCVAYETFRLFKRASLASRQTVTFKKTRTEPESIRKICLN